MKTNSPSGLGLGGYMAILRRRWIFFIIPVLVLPWAAFFNSSSQPDRFTATARVLLGDTAAEAVVDDTSQNTSLRTRLLENELRLATSDEAADEVARRFGVDEAPSATITANNQSDVLDFRATASNPDSAANVANAWAETYLDLKREQSTASIEDATVQLEARLAELQEDRQDLQVDLVRLLDQLARSTNTNREAAQLAVDREESRIAGRITLLDSQINATVVSLTDLSLERDLTLGSGPRLVTAAKPPTQSTNSSPLRGVILGLILGSILGSAAALLRETFDNAVNDAKDLDRLGLVHLGSVPRPTPAEMAKELALSSLDNPEGAQAAAYQKVRSSIDFIAFDQQVSSIVVTSALQGEGKTTAATNLATAMAQSGKRTILVDSDLRRPRIHKVFSTRQSPGLTNFVLDNDTLTESAWPIPALAESFVVVPSGALPPHPPSFLSSPDFEAATRTLGSLGDFVITDAAPTLPVADTLALVEHIPDVVLVVAAGRTEINELKDTIAELTSAGANILGAVLIGVRRSSKSYEYYESDDESLGWLSPDELVRAEAKSVAPDEAVTAGSERSGSKPPRSRQSLASADNQPDSSSEKATGTRSGSKRQKQPASKRPKNANGAARTSGMKAEPPAALGLFSGPSASTQQRQAL